MGWEMLLAGGLGAIGGVAQGYFQQQAQESANNTNMYMQDKANAFNAEQARENRQFQEQMSNTAYQRARKDMEAAGYNPMLAFQQGGASTPSGSSASGAAAHVEAAPNNMIGNMLSSAKEMMAMTADLRKMEAETKASNANAELHQAMKGKIPSEIEETSASAKQKKAQTELIGKQMEAAKNSESRAKVLGDIQGAAIRAMQKWWKQNGSAVRQFKQQTLEGGFGGDAADLVEDYFGPQDFGTPAVHGK